MMSLTFAPFTQVNDLGPHDPFIKRTLPSRFAISDRAHSLLSSYSLN